MNQVLPSKTHQVDSKQDYGPQVRTNLTLKKILHRVVKLILQGKADRDGPRDATCAMRAKLLTARVTMHVGYWNVRTLFQAGKVVRHE